jgi:hypothetical protein
VRRCLGSLALLALCALALEISFGVSHNVADFVLSLIVLGDQSDQAVADSGWRCTCGHATGRYLRSDSRSIAGYSRTR